YHNILHLLLTLRPPPTPPLFPYTTLFRSPLLEEVIAAVIANLIDQLPMCVADLGHCGVVNNDFPSVRQGRLQLVHPFGTRPEIRSEEHTSELQSPCNLVCRLLLEKKKNKS